MSTVDQKIDNLFDKTIDEVFIREKVGSKKDFSVKIFKKLNIDLNGKNMINHNFIEDYIEDFFDQNIYSVNIKIVVLRINLIYLDPNSIYGKVKNVRVS